MVKKPVTGNGTSRIRFIMLEAEMPEGDLTQITNAIQNALRPASINGPRVPKPQGSMVSADENDEQDVVDGEEADDAAPNESPAKSTAQRKWKPAKRKVVDIDLDKEPSLESFVAKYQPKTDRDKHLVVVAFLTEHRAELEGANLDHVYTCFRKLGWPSGAKDFGQPLRDLKATQLVDQGKAKGTYVTNHIGLDKVHKMAGD